MTKWLMVGTAPSVMRTLTDFRGWEGRVITTNAGINLWPKPDVWVLIDAVASKRYAEESKAAQREGVRLVTLHRDSDAGQESRCVTHFDEFIKCQKQQPPSQTRFGRFRYSGPFCLEYACHRGATEVHLIGFDGYRWLHDYYDGAPDKPEAINHTKGVQRTADVLRPACEDIARAWNGKVRFIRYGEPTFSVGSSNWEEVAC